VGPFDVVVCWLVGTHRGRELSAINAGYRFRSSQEYRLRVQNKVYELADEILRSGGVLQVVDRGEYPETEAHREDWHKAHRDQASVTSLDVAVPEHCEYEEPTEGKHVTMEKSLPLSGRDFDVKRLALLSVISKKPGR